MELIFRSVFPVRHDPDVIISPTRPGAELKAGKIQKTLTTLVISVLLAFVLASPGFAAAPKGKSQSNAANPRYAAIVIDADTGAVLFERSADKKLHPASLVKMMTLLMAFEAIENGSATMNSRVRISAHANAQPPSKLGLKVGSSIAMKDAILALVTKSANDIATAMGETIGGSEARFVAMMNQKARDIGMTQTTFKNASGLHHPEMVSSARDMARLSRHLVMNYPKQYKYFSTRNFSYNGVSHHNHNRLMETYKGMDGIKTGYIQPSGFNLAASAVRGDHRLIAVVFGGRTTQSRNSHVAELLDQGFARYGASARIAAAKSIDDELNGTLVAMAPIPGRKPAQRDMLQDGAAKAGQQVAAVSPAAGNGIMGSQLIGEGDFDPAVAKRFEAGMMAIAALKGDMAEPSGGAAALAQPPATPQNAGQIPANVPDKIAPVASATGNGFARPGAIVQNDWALQVGAFTSRVRSDQALNEAVQKLPPGLRSQARPVIVPMKVGDGWVFRARIRGLSREQAMASCKYFENCMAISPRAF